jgi:hypothetical protein
MRNTTLTALLGLALTCTLVLAIPSPASAASSVGAAAADAGSWSPLALWQGLQGWWMGLFVAEDPTEDPTVKGGLIMDPDGAPASTTTSTADFPTDPEKGLVIDPDGLS